jgi:hypothetical protein
MYGWIWRHLPGNRAAKLVASTVLISALGAALWFFVFPAVEPMLPFDDVQIATSR